MSVPFHRPSLLHLVRSQLLVDHRPCLHLSSPECLLFRNPPHQQTRRRSAPAIPPLADRSIRQGQTTPSPSLVQPSLRPPRRTIGRIHAQASRKDAKRQRLNAQSSAGNRASSELVACIFGLAFVARPGRSNEIQSFGETSAESNLS